MNKRLLSVLIVGVCLSSNKVIAGPVCSPDLSALDNMNVLRKVVMQTKKMGITQKFHGVTESIVSNYTFDIIDLDSTDFLIKTQKDDSTPPQIHGIIKNIYVGLDNRNEEIDLLFFRAGMGVDERFLASFKVQKSDNKCVLATPHYDEKRYAQLTIDSWSSLRLEYYLIDDGEIDEYAPNYIFQ
ncbi:MAG: hypothetical protein ACJAYN_002699 [Bermanella sp.]|jgi:hypothetical protein|uniref:hypothetical protein n=1 Tax=Glaciecola sp. 33A TaxID=2057807 RepID=UPI000C339E75|nr:hypothetical protein [Glaciecola sp. 33A]PKI00844.1 hypothetical protein CXF81_12985 [Glaciecola sp. 33A]